MVNKFREKSYLCHYDLSIDLFKALGVNVTDVVPVRNVFIVSTDKGDMILKKIDYSEEQLKFICSGIKYIKNKFNRVMDFVQLKNGDISLPWKSDLYCLMYLVNGRECDYSNPVDIKIASEGLGEFHKSSEGFRSTYMHKYNNGRIIDNFKRRLEEINFFKSIANMHDSKNEFDTIFLSNVDYYIGEIRKSIDILEKSPYYKICSEEDTIVLCHHDLAHHNIIIKDNEAYFIDFDYSIIDIKVHDLCNFINKVIKNFAFDEEKAKQIINCYNSVNNIDARELKVLYGMLTFPVDFYTISKDYYTRLKQWDEEVFISRLLKKCQYKEFREEFLKSFYEFINHPI